MQTILGATGHIGRPLGAELSKYTDRIRLVSRNPQKVNPNDELHPADLLNPEEVVKAVEGSEIVYLTIGLPYRDHIWQKHWVPLIESVIAACKAAKAKLVFFDNVYMYAPDQIDGMTEDAVVNPATVKGQIRAEVARQVLDAHHSGSMQTLIARAADFYGPNCSSSVIHETVIVAASKGKTMRWLYDQSQPHNFTYTPDAAKATAQLGNDPEAFGRVWHLPSSEAFTGWEWMQKIWTSAGRSIAETPENRGRLYPQNRKHADAPPKMSTLGGFLMQTIGLFIPDLKSLHKMRYQYQNPYRLDDSAFTARYGWQATDADEAIGQILAALG
ncbi:MAG: NAD-dependent epimerase/dehydratase family protein [Bacteroidota bacterium]